MRNRIKRFLSIILMCSVLVGVCWNCSVGALDNEILLSADPITVNAGNQFEVPIKMTGGQGIMGFSVSFSYDETALKPISVTPADGIPGGWENSIETSKDNTFSVVWYGTENMTVQGTVFTLKFEAKARAIGDYTIQIGYDQASTFNEAWQDVVLQTGAISVHVDNANPSPDFRISDASVTAGDVYSCDVIVHNNVGIGVVSFALSFDASALVPTEIHDGIGTVLSSNLTGTSGTVQVIVNQVSADGGDGVLFTVLFQTSENKRGSFPITMTNSADYVCEAGTVTINKDVPTGTPVVDIQQDFIIEEGIITVPVHISNNTGLMGLRLRLTINVAQFDMISCEKGAALNVGGESAFNYTFDDATGIVDILWSSSEASYINDVCCTVKIQIVDFSADALEMQIDYEPEDTFDESLTNVPLTCRGSVIPIRNNVLITEIAINTLPTKTDYTVGDTLDITGLSLLVTKSDGTTETVITGFTCTPTQFSAVGTQTITVTYQDQTVTFTVDVSEALLSGDVNEDGSIDGKDVVILQRYLAGGWDVTIHETNADVDKDGEICAKDDVLLQRYLAGGWGVTLI